MIESICAYSKQSTDTIDINYMFTLASLLDEYEIAMVSTFPELRNYLLECYYEDVDTQGQFSLSFDAAKKLKSTLKWCFTQHFGAEADERWQAAEGDSCSVGIVVRQSASPYWHSAGITSGFILFRVMVTYIGIKDLLPLFEKRFRDLYRPFLLAVKKGIGVIPAFAYLAEAPES